MNVRYFLFVLLYVFTFLLIPSVCLSEETIKGHYCYTYGGRETSQEARDLTRTMSIRNGIESYGAFIEATGKVTNFTLTNDLIQIISSGYLKNMEVLEHTEQDRTICETISGTVEPRQIEKIIESQVQKRIKKVEDTVLDNNGYLKILRTYETATKYYDPLDIYAKIHIVCEVLKDTTVNNSNVDYMKVYVDMLNLSGEPIGTSNDLVSVGSRLISGEIINFDVFKEGESYKVWLYGGQRFVTDETKSEETKQVQKQTSKEYTQFP
jgi:hypothetical protein